MGVRPALGVVVALLGLAASGAGVGCGPAREAKAVSLRMSGGPPNASVTIDDHFVGTLDVVSARGVAVPPGSHRISVEAAGFLPWDKIVEAKEGAGPLRLDVRLAPVPD
jgi:hypothetical protein